MASEIMNSRDFLDRIIDELETDLQPPTTRQEKNTPIQLRISRVPHSIAHNCPAEEEGGEKPYGKRKLSQFIKECIKTSAKKVKLVKVTAVKRSRAEKENTKLSGASRVKHVRKQDKQEMAAKVDLKIKTLLHPAESETLAINNQCDALQKLNQVVALNRGRIVATSGESLSESKSEVNNLTLGMSFFYSQEENNMTLSQTIMESVKVMPPTLVETNKSIEYNLDLPENYTPEKFEYNGVDLSSIDGKNLTTYAINVAKALFTDDELQLGYIPDPETSRSQKKKLPLDEDRVQVLKDAICRRFNIDEIGLSLIWKKVRTSLHMRFAKIAHQKRKQ